MKANHTIYQLIKKRKDGTEKVVYETDAASVESAMDYFFIIKPNAYNNGKYRIGIKPMFVLD